MTTELYSPHKIREARRLFGFAVKHQPLTIFEEIDSHLPSRMAFGAYSYIRDRAQAVFSPDEVSESAYSLLRCGIKDTQDVIHPYIEPIVDQSGSAAALDFIRHPITIHSLAVVALRTEDMMHGILHLHTHRQGKGLFNVTDDGAGLEVTPSFPQPNKKLGCPLAGINGEIDIDPLFAHFVDWAGQLCVASIAHKLEQQSAPVG